MPLPHLIFDLGGVLVAWDPAAIARTFTPDPALQARLLADIFQHPDWAERDRGVTPAAELHVRFAARAGLPPAEMDRLMHIVRGSLTLLPDTAAWLRELHARGHRLFCLSNMPQDHYQSLRAAYDFWDVFEGIVISGAVGLIKPEAAIFTHLLGAFGLDAADCIFIDDVAKNIAAAGRLGMRGIQFTEIAQARAELERLTG
jgi:putative hydrolase of the HAD superfamily